MVRLLAALLPAACLALSAPASAQGQGGPVPVTVTAPIRQNVPVLARAIGTVQAYQSVNVRARVDGTLDKVLFTEGQTVKPGDLLAQIDPRPYQATLEQARAKQASDEAAAANSRADLQRYAELAQSQVASRQRLDLQRSNLAQAEAALRGSEAAVAAAALNLSYTQITSPIEGRVGLRQVDAGNMIRAADPNTSGIATISQIRPIALTFTLPQDVLPRVQAAMRRGPVPVMAFTSDDRTQLSAGELLTVDNAIDAATGTIRLKAKFANADDALWPGQFVNVRVQLDTRTDAVTVPSAAVQRGQSGMFVFIARPDNTAAVQPVDIAQDDGKLAVVTKGLSGEERVVLSGQSRLSNGARVNPTDAKQAGQEGSPRT